MKCYAAQNNLLKPAEGNSGAIPSCVTTSAGFFIGDIEMIEKWKQVVGWPDYEISDQGNIKGRYGIVKTFLVKGYLAFNVCIDNRRKSLRVHREVLRAFVDDRSELCACHNDGNTQNCCLDNLRWDTHKGNESDKIIHGTCMIGEKHHQHKLTREQALFIKTSTEKGVVLAKRFNVTSANICAIRRGRSWRCLSA